MHFKTGHAGKKRWGGWKEILILTGYKRLKKRRRWFKPIRVQLLSPSIVVQSPSSTPPKLTVSSFSADHCTNGGSSQRRPTRIVSPESTKLQMKSEISALGGSEVEVHHHCHGLRRGLTPPPSRGSNAIGSQRSVSGVTFPVGREAENRLYVPEKPVED